MPGFFYLQKTAETTNFATCIKQSSMKNPKKNDHKNSTVKSEKLEQVENLFLLIEHYLSTTNDERADRVQVVQIANQTILQILRR